MGEQNDIKLRIWAALDHGYRINGTGSPLKKGTTYIVMFRRVRYEVIASTLDVQTMAINDIFQR